MNIFVIFLPLVILADLKIELEYSFDDFANVFELGKVDLRRQFDGNFTGIFTPKADNFLADRLRSNINGLYKVRTKGSPGGELSSSSKPCLILKSKLFHYLWFTIDSDRQLLHSFTVFPDVLAAGGQINSDECSEDELKSVSGAPRGTVHVANKGVLPNPDTQSFVNKMERERKARQHGAETDNRSFLAKYWMYIVPVVAFVLISNAVNPEAQGQGE